MSTPADLVARGIASAQAGRWAEALEQFERSVAIAPGNAAVWSNIALALRTLGRTEEAARAIEQALSIDASIADAWNVRGLIDLDRRRFEPARAHFRKAIELNGRHPQAWMNLGNSEQALGNVAAASEAYARALALEPRLPELHYNLGLLRQNALGDVDQAMACYREAIRLAPDYALAHNNLAHALFLVGRFDQAWREHAWRRTGRGLIAGLGDARRVAIVAEQGLGDILFYLRFAPALRDRGVALDFAGDARLHPMLARTGLFERLAASASELGEGRHEVLAGDLALAAALPGHSIAVPPPLPIAADAARLAAMRARLAAFGPAPYVAVAWRSGVPKTGLHETLYKTAPIDLLGSALRGMDATFISVQRDPTPEELHGLASALGRPMHDLSEVNRDLEDTLALMDCADKYVGVSSTNVHLRASLGRDGHVLVPFPPEWRWMAAGDSPWFPAMRVYRQDASRDWGPAFAGLVNRLSRPSP